MNIGDSPSLHYAPINNANVVGLNTIIAAAAGKGINIWKILVVATAAGTIQFQDGGNNLSGAIPVVANGSVSLPFDGAPWLKTSLGNAFNITTTGAGQVLNGWVAYTLSPENVQP